MNEPSKDRREDLEDVALGNYTTALLGRGNGKYPDANALLVRGTRSTLLIDPALGVVPRLPSLPHIDIVVLTHCHEDHIPALRDLPDAECWVHEQDHCGLLSIEGFLDIFGMPEPRRSQWRRVVVERFSFEARPDARAFVHGHVWELGGASVRAHHAPGHTRGHCLFEVQPDGVLFLGDIDLSSFGPYYGDAWSDLEAFETTLQEARSLEARHYVSGHHIGVLDRPAYLERLERYTRRIADREERLLSFLGTPRSLDQIVAHRFIYRPGDDLPGIEKTERRSMSLHLERLTRDGRVRKTGERFVATVGDTPTASS